MKAAYIEKLGPPENIRFGEFPTPVVGADDVLARVSAVCVDPVDTYIRSGKVPMPLPLPFIIGRDMAGVVEAVGSNVTQFAAGDRVWCDNQGIHGRQGTFAEYVSIPERLLYHMPAEADEKEMVAFVHSGLTAYTGLKRVSVRRGESLFLNGGAGNVGSAVVQLAKALEARVLTTAGTAEGVAWCRSLGAEAVVNYKTEDVNAALEKFAPGGVDVNWDTSGHPDFDAAVKGLARNGRIVLMAGTAARPPFPVGPFYNKFASMIGFSITWLSDAELKVAADEMNSWAASGRMRVRISRTLPLSEAATAHQLMEKGLVHNGKLVLTP